MKKSDAWRILKSAGVPLEKKFVQYKLTELYDILEQHGLLPDEPQTIAPQSPPPPPPKVEEAPPDLRSVPRPAPAPRTRPENMDEYGRVWLQKEVHPLPAGAARPRRRFHRDLRGVRPESEVVQDRLNSSGTYETMDIPGEEMVATTITVTEPAYRTGLYIDPSFPWKVHTYDGAEGFDYEDVNNWFGGNSGDVPAEINRIYIKNMLCYDKSSLIRWIKKYSDDLVRRAPLR